MQWVTDGLQKRWVRTGGQPGIRALSLLLAEGQLRRWLFDRMLRVTAALPLLDRLASQKRERIERSEVIKWGLFSGERDYPLPDRN